MDWQRLSALHSERFPELPLDCGNDEEPGIRDTDEWRDWSELWATADQLQIEDYLDRVGTRGKSILHIGIGSSGLARRFTGHAAILVGTTVVPAELEKASSLALNNYRALIHNKYSGENYRIPESFDVIVDNNPTTFCCCIKHLGKMLEFYASKLNPHGQVITHRTGLGWKIDASGAHERWAFSFDDIAAVAPAAGLTAYQVTDEIYVLARSRPSRPTFASQADYYLRKFARKLWRAVTLRGRLLAR
jgi:hypothetical protein